MSKHYTRNTVSVAKWCTTCQAHTQHRIDDRRIGPCLRCIDRLEEGHRKVEPVKAPAQDSFKFV